MVDKKRDGTLVRFLDDEGGLARMDEILSFRIVGSTYPSIYLKNACKPVARLFEV